MLASKSKSGLSDTSNGKITPATPRVNKFGRAASTKSDSLSPSPLQKSRNSIDRSPKSVDSKPTVERRLPKTCTPPDKQPRGLKGTELQGQLGVIQEELNKVREQLASVEQEKAWALEELRDAKRSADEANEKLKEALIAQKWAEESSDIDKSRADELEQSGNDAAQKREEEWKNEVENIRNEHAVDLSALLSTTQELQRVRHELAMTSEAKNTALSHADDAMKIAEINAEKVEFLSREVSRLKALLDSKTEITSTETSELVKKLESEADALKHELERAKAAEDKLVEMEALVQGLRTEVIDAKRDEMDVGKLVDEWKRKAELLEVRVEEANRSEKETEEMVKNLGSEVDALKRELEEAKAAEEKLVEMEALVEGLRTEVTDAKRAEADAGKLLEETERKAELLEARLEEANRSENETAEVVKKLGSEVDTLKHELEEAKAAEEKLVEMEALVEGLRTEVTDAKRAEADSGKLLEERKRKAELLEVRLEEANRSENETAEVVKKLGSEVDALKHELERGKVAEQKLVEMEALLEGLRTEVTDAKRAETDASKLLNEWKRKAELLEGQVEESNQCQKSSLNSLALVSKRLEESNALLQDAKSETAALKGVIESLEIEVASHKADLSESNRRLDVAQQEALELGMTVEVLKSELQTSEEEKMQALNNEKVAASNIESLSEVRDKLINELEITKDEGEKAKKAMEGLASALHELSTETRETQERLLAKQLESEDAHSRIEELKSALKNTEERNEVMLDEARYELVGLRNSIEKYEMEAKTSRAEWDEKELNFVSAIKKSEEELASLKAEMGKVVDLLKGFEHEVQAAKDAGVQMLTKLSDAESAAAVANEAAEEAKAVSLQLKERLMDKENELQNITRENDDLSIREAAAVKELKELSVLLAEFTAKRTEENAELTNGEKEHNLPTNSTESQEENTDESETEKPKSEVISGKLEDGLREDTKENGNGNRKEDEEHVEVETKMWESCKVMDKDLASEREHEAAESTDDELDSKISSSSFDPINGLTSEKTDNGATSPTKSQQQKKKKALLHKFGSLLKKKSNHK